MDDDCWMFMADGAGDVFVFDGVVLGEAVGGLGDEDKYLPVHVEACGPCEKVCSEVVHASAHVSDLVKLIVEEIGCRFAEFLVLADELRDKRAANGIHRAVVDRLFDWAEVQEHTAGVAHQCFSVARWD